jgi:hypothetical protein
MSDYGIDNFWLSGRANAILQIEEDLDIHCFCKLPARDPDCPFHSKVGPRLLAEAINRKMNFIRDTESEDSGELSDAQDALDRCQEALKLLGLEDFDEAGDNPTRDELSDNLKVASVLDALVELLGKDTPGLVKDWLASHEDSDSNPDDEPAGGSNDPMFD